MSFSFNSVKENKKFIQNNILSLTVLFLNTLLTIIALKYNIKILGAEVYGLHLLLVNIATFMNLVNLGFFNNLIVNLNKSKNEELAKNTLITNYFGIHAFLGVAGFLIFNLLLNNSALITETPELFYNLGFINLKYLYPVLFLVQYLAVFFENILFYNFNVIKARYIGEFFKLGFSNLITCLCLIWNQNPVFLVAIPILISLGVLIFYLIIFYKKTSFRLHFSEFGFAFFFQNLRNSLSFWFLQISFLVLNSLDAIFISKYIGNMTLLVMYSQSFRLVNIPQKMISTIINNKSPKLLQKITSGDFGATKDIFNKMLSLSLTFSIVVAVGILLFGKWVLEFWLGESLEFDGTLIAIFAAILVSSNTYWVFWNFFNLIKLQNKIAWVACTEIVLNITLSYFLIQHFGLYGLASASLISNVISIILMFSMYRKFVFPLNRKLE